ncbi:MAG TPA: hypothetical protein VJX30_13895 [Terriglobales bacterium]|jgi:hypothetical protein|nr:hypothetical protein [Terriglobales bacterium]
MWAQSHLCPKPQRVSSVLAAAFALVFLLLGASQPASALPAFARKYGLRCSACHESWPALNNFGLKFRDNGYQLMNDRDSPIWQNPGYWPVTFRITPIWHRVSSLQQVDTYSTSGSASTAQRITSSGFDLSGLDFHTGGTLEKNFSFYVLPSSDSTGAFHFESVNARVDNIGGSPWLNIRLGKFELNNLLSEKRTLWLTGNGGIYQTYHFIPVNDGNTFGQMGDNQLGVEYMGHSVDDRTRVSAALLSSNDGSVGLITGANSYSGFFTFDQAFDAGKLGTERLGAYAFVGQAATYYLTNGGVPIPGSGIGNKSFSRVGFYGQFYLGPHFDINVVTQHGSDSAWFGQGYGNAIASDGNGTATCTAIPPPYPQPPCPPNNTPGTTIPGARAPTWNGYTFEARYVYSPQLIFKAVFEAERMSQQSTPGTPSNLGNINNYSIGYRYNPFMTSRAGFAYFGEFNLFHQDLTGPFNSAGNLTNINTSELLFGIDFDF